MEDLQTMIQKTVLELELDDVVQQTVFTGIANALAISNSKFQEYCSSPELQQKYDKDPETVDEEVQIYNDMGKKMGSIFRNAYDSRDEFESLGEQAEKLRDNLADSFTEIYVLLLSNQAYSDFIAKKVEGLADLGEEELEKLEQEGEEGIVNRTKEFAKEFVDKLEVKDETKTYLVSQSEFLARQFIAVDKRSSYF